MFQTFDVATTPETGPARLGALRAHMEQSELDGLIVPRADRFQGEYVAPADERLAWLTGFTGSAGFACVLPSIAGVFVDGRYRVQVRAQVAEVFTPVDWPETALSDWLKDNAAPGSIIGFDPWLHTVSQIEALTKALNGSGITLKAVDNAVDAIWTDRPAPPHAPFVSHPVEFAGRAASEKIADIAQAIQDAGCTCALITQPDSVAWLLNIRGTDIQRNPIPHAMALVQAAGDVALYCEPSQTNDIDLAPTIRVVEANQLISDLSKIDGPAMLDPETTPVILAESCRETVREPDPCSLPKAKKNATEIQGARDAHLRDGAAMVRFLAWLSAEAPNDDLTEIDVVTALEGFRRETNALRDISFDTICGSGPNGAIVHYRVNEETNRPMKTGELLLVDSGGQYQDGTTDITRTVAIGSVGGVEKQAYTRVLQGMIAMSRARFPKGVRGSDLDALARYPLWLAGQDYDHGTGHGVGSYMCVHEGPQGLHRRARTVLEPGMMLSNEPGYYREGAFGIRIENLIVVKDATPIDGGDARAMLDFETLTYVPFDRHLIVLSLLSDAERAWIDQYHSDTLAKIGPRVDGAAHDWLTAACAPL